MTKQKETQEMSQQLIITHKGCNDGFCASAIAYYYHVTINKSANFHVYDIAPGENIDVIREIIKSFSPDTKVEVFDLSLAPLVYDFLNGYFKDIILYDHHITTFARFKENMPSNFVFDNAHSAAYLAWKHYFPEKEVPLIVRYVEDRDLFKKELYPESEHFYEGVNAMVDRFDYKTNKKDFSFWVQSFEDPLHMTEVMKFGKVLCKIKDKDVKFTFRLGSIEIIDGRRVYLVNSNTNISDLGNYAVLNSDCDYAIVWRYVHKEKKYNCSLRSIDSKDDVAIIAEKYKGGGHRNASGFETTDLGKLLGLKNFLEPTVPKYKGFYEALKEFVYSIMNSPRALITSINVK